MNKKLMVMLMVVIAIILLLLLGMALRKSSAPAVDEWTANLQTQKQIPFQKGTFTPHGGESVAIHYRIFKPAIDINQIPSEPIDWRDNPIDSFLRLRYLDILAPELSFAKYAESFFEGMGPINRTLEKLPEYKHDPKGYFKKLRGDYDERKLLGEIIINDVHMLVYVYAKNGDWPSKRGLPFVKKDDGGYYAYPRIKSNNKLLDALAQDRYSIIFKHFPEYDGPKTGK